MAKRNPSEKPDFFQHYTIEELAAQQGVTIPADLDKMAAEADFWPEEESVDDFITTIREWRKEGTVTP